RRSMTTLTPRSRRVRNTLGCESIIVRRNLRSSLRSQQTEKGECMKELVDIERVFAGQRRDIGSRSRSIDFGDDRFRIFVQPERAKVLFEIGCLQEHRASA